MIVFESNCSSFFEKSYKRISPIKDPQAIIEGFLGWNVIQLIQF